MKHSQNYQSKSFRPGMTIFSEGDFAYGAYLLRSGRVEISTVKDGRRVVLSTIQPNQVFGELALIDNEPRSATATAVEECETLVIRREDFDRHIESLDEFMKYWIAYLTDRVRDLSRRVQD